MRVIESCAECLYDKQCHLSKDPAYLSEIRDIIRNRERFAAEMARMAATALRSMQGI
jgi:hypothetical protein